MKLGIVCFANDGGLGAQTRRLAYMLKPFRVMVINSTRFSPNKAQHLDWYEQFSGYTVDGFPRDREVRKFLQGLTHVLVCENPLNFSMFSQAKQMGIKSYCQSNYEFCDNLDKPYLPIPDMFLMPSYWKIEEMKERFGDDKVIHLPPPLDLNEFTGVREMNFNRKGQRLRLLHIVGTLAAHDRNGTLDLLRSLKFTDLDFELVIKSQHTVPVEYMVSDHRVRYKIGNERENAGLYGDFDAVILPRRYGGLSLVCNEALGSGLPVIMTNISPNNQLLPKEWVVDSVYKTNFMARVPIEVYAVDPRKLAEKIDWLVKQDLNRMKAEAFDLAYSNFSVTALRDKYEALW